MFLVIKKIFVCLIFFTSFIPGIIFASTDNDDTLIIDLSEDGNGLIQDIASKGYIDNPVILQIIRKLRDNGRIRSGGYIIDKEKGQLSIIISLIRGPQMEWVVIPEGYRKEQIAERLARSLGWTDEEKSSWINVTTASNPDYYEGVYFPDTYLIPKNETGEQVRKRLVNRFEEKFSDYSVKFAIEDIKWTTALKVASIVEREAKGKDDKAIIAGIIWNRLDKGMQLGVDATIQYIRDTEKHYGSEECSDTDKDCYQSYILGKKVSYSGGDDWWSPISVMDKQIDSEYNTYKNKGLPPFPICSPGIDSIVAVLSPAETDCLYYLHDRDGMIHCSATYEEHQENIDKYLLVN
jgi:UPF0755 protein